MIISPRLNELDYPLLYRCTVKLASGILLLAFQPLLVPAANFSFEGNFAQDDNVQLFYFTIGSTSTVTLRSWSYAGGVSAAGVTVPEGGFDPVMALFNSTGLKIADNDDGGPSVPASRVTGERFDVYLQETLAPGTYVASLMQFDNFAIGSNLSDGFTEAGMGDFTALFECSAGRFCDVDGFSRSPHFAFDLLNVDSASSPNLSPVPEPSSGFLLTVGLGGSLVVAVRELRRSLV
jgi:PEP-CTERM motif